ncbi:MAG: hypothetical protein M3N24_05680, partial [Actinomycetota bacterium]|nr:hypothetical protein [Actinomycetota bacterium]
AYRVSVDSYGSETGSFTLTWSLLNDNFSRATAISGSIGSVAGANDDFSGQRGEPDNARASRPIQSAWYKWTAPVTARVAFMTCGDESFDTTLGVYRGSAVNSLSVVAANDDGCGSDSFLSRVKFAARKGLTYRISVDGYQSETGPFTLSWTRVNDNFSKAVAISGQDGSVLGTNVSFTGQAGEPDNDGVSKPIQSAWYKWTAPLDGIAYFDTCGTGDFDTTLGVYRGSSVDVLSRVASNDDACDVQSEVAFEATEGVTYRISVDGFGSEAGLFLLYWYQEPLTPEASAD